MNSKNFPFKLKIFLITVNRNPLGWTTKEPCFLIKYFINYEKNINDLPLIASFPLTLIGLRMKILFSLYFSLGWHEGKQGIQTLNCPGKNTYKKYINILFFFK
jgi:hypothetical protein